MIRIGSVEAPSLDLRADAAQPLSLPRPRASVDRGPTTRPQVR
jgi:hypothetical protein